MYELIQEIARQCVENLAWAQAVAKHTPAWRRGKHERLVAVMGYLPGVVLPMRLLPASISDFSSDVGVFRDECGSRVALTRERSDLVVVTGFERDVWKPSTRLASEPPQPYRMRLVFPEQHRGGVLTFVTLKAQALVLRENGGGVVVHDLVNIGEACEV